MYKIIKSFIVLAVYINSLAVYINSLAVYVFQRRSNLFRETVISLKRLDRRWNTSEM